MTRPIIVRGLGTVPGTAGAAASAGAAKVAAEEARDEALAAAAQANAPTDGQVEISLANRGLPTSGADLSASIAQLAVWAANLDNLAFGTITRDANDAATSAAVKWPDGTPGTYTADTVSAAFPGAVDAYHVTYGDPATRTFTQPAVTRNANGAVTNRPEIVVS